MALSRLIRSMKEGLSAGLRSLSWRSLPAALVGGGIAYCSGPVLFLLAGPWGLFIFFTGPALLLGLGWISRTLIRKYPSGMDGILWFSIALGIGLGIHIFRLIWLVLGDLGASGWRPC